MVIPGNIWPFEFESLPVSARYHDSVNTMLIATSGNESDWSSSVQEFWFWGDSVGPHPPSAERPLDRAGYVLTNARSIWESNRRTSWDDRFSFSIEGLSREAVRISFVIRAFLTDRSQCSIVPCAEYMIRSIGRFSNGGDCMSERVIISTPTVHGHISEFAGMDSTGYPVLSKWEFDGVILSDFRVTLESRFRGFEAVDTITLDL